MFGVLEKRERNLCVVQMNEGADPVLTPLGARGAWVSRKAGWGPRKQR